jgi:hypothetical protein
VERSIAPGVVPVNPASLAGLQTRRLSPKCGTVCGGRDVGWHPHLWRRVSLTPRILQGIKAAPQFYIRQLTYDKRRDTIHPWSYARYFFRGVLSHATL